MKNYLEKLQTLVNREISDRGCTIKAFSVKCEVSYEEMRKICNGEINDIKASTVEKICDNSKFSINDIFSSQELMLNHRQIKIMIDERLILTGELRSLCL